MKRYVVTLLLILLVTRAHAQHEPAPPAQELEPVENALTYHTPAYPARMRQVLFKRAKWRNEFQFLSMPSFSPETLLTVRLEGDDYLAQVLHPEKQIWYYDGDDTDLKVIETEKRLPKPLTERVISLWQTMLLRTKFQRRNMDLDGMSYAFLGFAPGYSQLTAESRNPEPGTKPHMLASIGELLIDYVETNPDGEKQIEIRMKELMKRLEHALKTGEASNKRIECDSGKAAADGGLAGAVHP